MSIGAISGAFWAKDQRPSLRWHIMQCTIGCSGFFSACFEVDTRRNPLKSMRREMDDTGPGVLARLEGSDATEEDRDNAGEPSWTDCEREKAGRSEGAVGGATVQPKREAMMAVSDGMWVGELALEVEDAELATAALRSTSSSPETLIEDKVDMRDVMCDGVCAFSLGLSMERSVDSAYQRMYNLNIRYYWL